MGDYIPSEPSTFDELMDWLDEQLKDSEPVAQEDLPF